MQKVFLLSFHSLVLEFVVNILQILRISTITLNYFLPSLFLGSIILNKISIDFNWSCYYVSMHHIIKWVFELICQNAYVKSV